MIDLDKKIRAIPDFPKKGIIFRDITTLLGDAEGWREVIDRMALECAGLEIDAVAGAEARGFALAGPLAYNLGAKLILIRKPGKLPWKTISESYELEYGTDSLEVHKDALNSGDRVLVVDDLLATGGTAAATIKLVERLGAEVVSVGFIVELDDLGGRKKLVDYNCFSLIHY